MACGGYVNYTYWVRIRVRAMRPVEAAQVEAIDRELFAGDHRVQVGAGAPPGQRTWVAVESATGRVVAYASAKVCAPPLNAVMLTRVGVLPEARGLGLQRRLIRARVRWAARVLPGRPVYTYTRPHVPVTARNLASCGFLRWRPRQLWWGERWGTVIYWWRPCAQKRRST